ncbi:unnamed protein product [Adineta steineri]|nr:unnamed protein product [Adineta steineri]
MTLISSCIVMKWNDDHLVAYIQSSNIDQNQIHEHCQSHLPPHMIPSKFIILDRFPLNANGKVDRKALPSPESRVPNIVNSDLELPVTPLEEHLRRIFRESFHTESPDINTSFGQMGGTSLDVMRALGLIRKEICTKIDAFHLFANPSIRQLARIIEAVPADQNALSFTTVPLQLKVDLKRPVPFLCVELVGILLLMFQWIFPLWFAYNYASFLMLLLMPLFHLLSYVVCQRVLLRSRTTEIKTDKLYSWQYYRWWFLNNLWCINNSYWLQHLVGTSVYNSYLRLCGARIGKDSHIYTILIDAPWLVEIGASTVIGEDVVFSIGSVTAGYYPISSNYYLHKIWLRQLIISSFRDSLDLISSYDALTSIFLRYLGAHIEDDVKIADIQHLLCFPTNLLHIKCGVTTFGGVKLTSFQLTKEGLCYLDKIELGSNVTLGNGCIIMPGTQLSSNTMVGSLTLVTRETTTHNNNSIILGIPACEMPFTLSNNIPSVHDLSYSNSFSNHNLVFTCIGTQFLIILFRAIGARIGSDVILSHINCLTDPHLVTIEDHVRLNMGAYIQCHTFEQRFLKEAPIIVKHSSVIMNSTLILSGATLHGQNRILPLTLVMKDDQLPSNTDWFGVPAQQVV